MKNRENLGVKSSDSSMENESGGKDDPSKQDQTSEEKISVNELKDEKKDQPLQGHTSALTGSGNIEKIRDILFGGQMREYEKRFTRLEDRLQKEINGLKEDFRKSFDSLESFTKREFELLNERQQKEQSERYAAVHKLSEELKEASLALERKIAEIEDQMNKKARDLHEQILAQSKSLLEEIHQKHEVITGLLEKEAQELRDEKMDRANLSELFMEIALRVNKGNVDFDLAANELFNE